ncbi:hypothetical protein MNBD_UNCLBAC01-259 [hydrothermal vent metagenome]|uniref:SpoVT-AbrB domain-containing protein n=1 Tax=hydrothermal vent metagenome TaxID=652676 RepID=A0A3B1D2N1_9ZZZZ
MYITQATIKGQVLIPVELRKKYHIQKGSKFAVLEGVNEIVLKPLKENPIEYGHGLIKGVKGKSALKELLVDRKKEAKR